MKSLRAVQRYIINMFFYQHRRTQRHTHTDRSAVTHRFLMFKVEQFVTVLLSFSAKDLT